MTFFNIFLFDFHISVRINIVGIALCTLNLHWGFYTKTQKFGKSAGEGQLIKVPPVRRRKKI